MADRSGSQSSVVITMKVATTPEAHLAFTNLAYCSPSDLSQFAILGTNFFLANVADVFTLSLSGHESIQDGTIALNAVQRRQARVSADDMVTITRFVPPEKFDLILLALELEFVKKGTKNEQVDAVVLSTQLKKKFMYQKLFFVTTLKTSFYFNTNNIDIIQSFMWRKKLNSHTRSHRSTLDLTTTK